MNQYYLTRLINNDVILSDEEINGKGFRLDLDRMSVGFIDSNTHYNDPKNGKFKKIIASTLDELKLFNIDYSELSEKDRKKIGYFDVYAIAENKILEQSNFKIEGMSDYQNGKYNGFIEGFELAQSLNDKKYSEEDLKLAITAAWTFGQSIRNNLTDQMDLIIRSLNKPKIWKIEIEQVKVLSYKDKNGNVRTDKYYPAIRNNFIKILTIGDLYQI